MVLTLRRKLTFYFVALALTLSAVTQTAFAQTVTKDIPYTTRSQVEKADLYQPSGPGPFPAIVYIHGGSWRSGNKSDFKRLATDLAAQGYLGLSIDYNLKSHSYPVAWQQSRDAIRFLTAHAADYHIDPARIIVVGTSAGGEIAALLALDPDGPVNVADQTPVPVAAAVILNGVYDLCYPAHVIKRYLSNPAAAACKDASPLDHIHPGAPPFFVGHGTADHLVPYIAAQNFTDALRRSNIFVANFDAAGGPHSYWAKKKFYAANLTAVEYFLHTRIGQHGSAEVSIDRNPVPPGAPRDISKQ